MAIYNASELMSKLSHGKRKIREFEPKLGKLYRLWIPKNEVCYVKKHFNIQSIPSIRNCRLKAVTCINTDPGKPVRSCPICEYIDAQWRNTNDKKEKEEIQKRVNKLSATYFYVNAIDADDADLQFVALRLTKSLFESFSMAIHDTPIENIIWQFKKTEKNGKIEYMLLESPNDSRAVELCNEYDMLAMRPFADGGPIDLDAALTYETNEKDYINLLTGNGDSNEIDDDSVHVPETAPKKKVESKSKSVVVDDEDISLDDIGLDDLENDELPKSEPVQQKPVADLDDDLELSDDFGLDDVEPKVEPKVASKVASKKVEPKAEPKAEPKEEPKAEDITLDDGDITLDDLDLDDLELDDVEPVNKIKVGAAQLNENKTHTEYVQAVINALAEQGKMTVGEDYRTNLKTAYAVLKKNNLTVEINEPIGVPF